MKNDILYWYHKLEYNTFSLSNYIEFLCYNNQCDQPQFVNFQLFFGEKNIDTMNEIVVTCADNLFHRKFISKHSYPFEKYKFADN